MTLCVISGKQCQCQPDEGVACDEGSPAEVQEALRAELHLFRKDAQRYRWLRVGPNVTQDGTIDVALWSHGQGTGLRLEVLDAEIDAAMAKPQAVG